MSSLLAVDLGLKTGLALYDKDLGLKWYRSHNFGSPARLKRGVQGILGDIAELDHIVIEGGGSLADIWIANALRRDINLIQIGAEKWRQELLYARQYKSGSMAKRHADTIARNIIRIYNAPRPTSLRHDAAEAILIGLWAIKKVGWIDAFPKELQ
jgi:hypothetical protein